jgi:hypothetical protein
VNARGGYTVKRYSLFLGIEPLQQHIHIDPLNDTRLGEGSHGEGTEYSAKGKQELGRQIHDRERAIAKQRPAPVQIASVLRFES